MSSYRIKAIDAHGKVCSNCGSDEAIEVHHRDGDRTNNSIDNLLPLCRRCHRRLHSVGLDGLEEELLPTADRPQLSKDTTTYQLGVDDDTWNDWKDTVPRSKALDVRLVELIEADTEGRIEDEPE